MNCSAIKNGVIINHIVANSLEHKGEWDNLVKQRRYHKIGEIYSQIPPVNFIFNVQKDITLGDVVSIEVKTKTWLIDEEEDTEEYITDTAIPSAELLIDGEYVGSVDFTDGIGIIEFTPETEGTYLFQIEKDICEVIVNAQS